MNVVINSCFVSGSQICCCFTWWLRSYLILLYGITTTVWLIYFTWLPSQCIVPRWLPATFNLLGLASACFFLCGYSPKDSEPDSKAPPNLAVKHYPIIQALHTHSHTHNGLSNSKRPVEPLLSRVWLVWPWTRQPSHFELTWTVAQGFLAESYFLSSNMIAYFIFPRFQKDYTS